LVEVIVGSVKLTVPVRWSGLRISNGAVVVLRVLAMVRSAERGKFA